MDRKQKAQELRGREVRRCTAKVELREQDGTLTLDGYASVTGVYYDMGWYKEQVRQGAFAKTLSETPDVQLLVNHEGLPLARTGRNLTLEEDNHGLHVNAEVDASDPDVDRLARKMRGGLVDEMSFAFRATRQEWDEDYEQRDILEVNIDKGDVSVVNYGANPATHVSFRAYADALMEVRVGKTLSTDTLNVLNEVLGLVADADDNLDDALEQLSDLMGVENPDEPEGGDEPPEDEAKAAMSLDVALAIAQQYRRKAA